VHPYTGFVLVELHIENLAVAEQLRLRFKNGFLALTGETGSGKSIIIDALGLLFGGRASADLIRAGSDRARVSGIFELPTDPDFKAVLEAAGIESEDDELLIAREIQSNGKSRAFVSSRPVAATLLREIAPFLGDIHGQHDQQRLFAADEQLAMLDEFGQTDAALKKVSNAFKEWRSCQQQLKELDKNETDKLRLMDMWSFQRKEIEAVHPELGEDVKLENDVRVLQNSTKLLEQSEAAYAALYEEQHSAVAQIKMGMRKLEELSRIDESMKQHVDSLKSAQILVDEVSFELREYLGRIDGDPTKLDEMQTRLAAIDKLKRKYGQSIEEVRAFLSELELKIDSVENAAEYRAELESRLGQLAKKYESEATALSKLRAAAGEKLARSVEGELRSLAMGKTRFHAELTRGSWTDSGFDQLTLMISANVGEDLKPLDKIASGGELSRVALALKTVTLAGQKGRLRYQRTLVFDEVDAGIGGVAAESVGKRLKKLAQSSQVLCVTHLAQIAGFADQQYSVAKQEKKGRTVATVEQLDGPARVREIGRMLSGEHLTPEALKHAEQLIERAAV
jgi:DNA repair protein RecN (Recombination protein N)